jgi:hypothetical protein
VLVGDGLLAVRRWSAVVLLAGLGLAFVLGGQRASGAPSHLVPRFNVTAKVSAIRSGGHRAIMIRELRVTGIYGHLHVSCNGCQRYPGHIRRHAGRHRLRVTGVNWLITPRHTVLVSVTSAGKVGRFVRLGIAAAHPNRLVFRASGCITNRLHLLRCPTGTSVPVVNGTVPTTTVVPPPPPPPTPPQMSPPSATATATSLDVSWNAPSDPSGIRSYTVWLDGDVNQSDVTVTHTTITGLACGTTYTVGVTATDNAGNVSSPVSKAFATSACPPQPVTHYNCPGTGNEFPHYVPAGKHWGNDFIAQGRTITSGTLLIGANVDGNDHRAKIGVFTGGPDQLAGELGSTVVDVSGYGGVSFTFPTPINVTPGQSLWLVAIGIGDFTAYDQNSGGADGCFVGSLTGFQ